IKSGALAADAVAALIRHGTTLDGYTRQIVSLYGRGEPGWLGRQIAKLPDAVPRFVVKCVLGSSVARRRVVFDSIFGMREVISCAHGTSDATRAPSPITTMSRTSSTRCSSTR